MKLDGAHSSPNTLDTQLQAIRSKSKLYLNSFFVATSSWRLLTCAKRECVLVALYERMRVWVIDCLSTSRVIRLLGFLTRWLSRLHSRALCRRISSRAHLFVFMFKTISSKSEKMGGWGGGEVVGGIKVAKKDYRWSCRSLLGGYLSSTSAEFSTKE